MARIAPFEQYTKHYEAWFEDNVFAYRSEILAVKKLLPSEGKGIEIGVGSGRFSSPFGIDCGIEPSELRDLKKIEPVKKGYGEGSFVVIRGEKNTQLARADL